MVAWEKSGSDCFGPVTGHCVPRVTISHLGKQLEAVNIHPVSHSA